MRQINPIEFITICPHPISELSNSSYHVTAVFQLPTRENLFDMLATTSLRIIVMFVIMDVNKYVKMVFDG